jgi:CDP-glucose 4,6-dehydratase
VTGATGFLGSHLTELLVALDADVATLRRDDVPPTPVVRRWLGAVSIVEGACENQAVVERLLGEYEVATLFHLAAQTQVGVANRNPVATFESNVRGTWSVLEAARRSPTVHQVLVASSDKAYGAQPQLPYVEDMPLRATHPYDASKACADVIAQSFAATFGLRVAVTRCGNFFGPGDGNWERLVPGTARSVIEGRRPIIRSDGTLTRDYLYVVDGALAYLRLAEAMAEDPGLAGQAFNFSAGRPLSVLDVVALVQAAAGTTFEPDVRATSTNEIAHQYLSPEKAERVLGWSPRYSLEEAMDLTVRAYREDLPAMVGG